MPPPINYLQNKKKKFALGPASTVPKREKKSHTVKENAEYFKKGKKKIHIGGQQKK